MYVLRRGLEWFGKHFDQFFSTFLVKTSAFWAKRHFGKKEFNRLAEDVNVCILR